MPLFLVHGFRWERKDIRIFVILNKLQDATPDYLMAKQTPSLFRKALARKYPETLANLPDLTFVEQYDPEDLHTGAQPYAYVANRVIPTDLSIEVSDLSGHNIGIKAWDAIADLRDELAKNEKVGWYVVWNGDVERADVGDVEEDEADGHQNSVTSFPVGNSSSDDNDDDEESGEEGEGEGDEEESDDEEEEDDDDDDEDSTSDEEQMHRVEVA